MAVCAGDDDNLKLEQLKDEIGRYFLKAETRKWDEGVLEVCMGDF